MSPPKKRKKTIGSERKPQIGQNEMQKLRRDMCALEEAPPPALASIHGGSACARASVRHAMVMVAAAAAATAAAAAGGRAGEDG